MSHDWALILSAKSKHFCAVNWRRVGHKNCKPSPGEPPWSQLFWAGNEAMSSSRNVYALGPLQLGAQIRKTFVTFATFCSTPCKLLLSPGRPGLREFNFRGWPRKSFSYPFPLSRSTLCVIDPLFAVNSPCERDPPSKNRGGYKDRSRDGSRVDRFTQNKM